MTDTLWKIVPEALPSIDSRKEHQVECTALSHLLVLVAFCLTSTLSDWPHRCEPFCGFEWGDEVCLLTESPDALPDEPEASRHSDTIRQCHEFWVKVVAWSKACGVPKQQHSPWES